MPDRPRNVGASVRQRLLNLARARAQPMELLLTRYALERLLHRLSLSPHRERFVLKGAMLLATWFDEPHRATRDVDLLGFGDAAQDALLGTFREIMAVEVDDGVTFDLEGLRIEAIREEVEYGGSRLRTTAALAGARIPITVDIGFGHATEPGVEDIDLPVLLDMPSPHLRAEPERMRRAIKATFARRNTEIPATVLDGLSDTFSGDAGKRRQWDAFGRSLSIQVPELDRVVRELRDRLMLIAGPDSDRR